MIIINNAMLMVTTPSVTGRGLVKSTMMVMIEGRELPKPTPSCPAPMYRGGKRPRLPEKDAWKTALAAL